MPAIAAPRFAVVPVLVLTLAAAAPMPALAAEEPAPSLATTAQTGDVRPASVPVPLQKRLTVGGHVVARGDYTFETPRTVRVGLPVEAFVLLRSDEDDVWWIDTAGYGFINGGSSPFDVSLGAAVDLPDGATVTRFACTYYDDFDGGGDVGNLMLIAELSRRARNEPYGESMASVFAVSAGTSTDLYAISTEAIAFPQIDTFNYDYRVAAQPQVDTWSHQIRFYGCEVDLTLDRVPVP